LLPSVLPEGTRHLFVPAERKIPKIRIETRQAVTLSSQKIIVAIDSWPRTSRYPLGHFVRALGNIGDKDTENEVTIYIGFAHFLILSWFHFFFSLGSFVGAW
jgi:exosome complex exonuclease DIS3/RRP44